MTFKKKPCWHHSLKKWNLINKPTNAKPPQLMGMWNTNKIFKRITQHRYLWIINQTSLAQIISSQAIIIKCTLVISRVSTWTPWRTRVKSSTCRVKCHYYLRMPKTQAILDNKMSKNHQLSYTIGKRITKWEQKT